MPSPSSLISVLVLLLSVYSAHAAGDLHSQQPGCKILSVRKEWRALTHPEKSQWIEAVKVDASIRPQHKFRADIE
jgi:tyrosinase